MTPNPCFHCLNGNGSKCTAVECYGCDCGCRTRSHGQPASSVREHNASTFTLQNLGGGS